MWLVFIGLGSNSGEINLEVIFFLFMMVRMVGKFSKFFGLFNIPSIYIYIIIVDTCEIGCNFWHCHSLIHS